jgi:hypothetical protein
MEQDQFVLFESYFFGFVQVFDPSNFLASGGPGGDEATQCDRDDRKPMHLISTGE